jgi:putative tricarboxylic transport membrane protein
MKPFVRSGDFWAGIVLAALGAFIVTQARGWVYMAEDGPGAGFFPMWYGAVMVVLSLALVAMSILRPAAHAPVVWNDLGRALGCWAAFVACIALMPLAGFAVSFALLTWFIVRVMAGRAQLVAISVAAGFALGFYALFELALDLALPHGLLF